MLIALGIVVVSVIVLVAADVSWETFLQRQARRNMADNAKTNDKP